MRFLLLLVPALAFAPVGAALAGEARTVFTASATVLPVVSLQSDNGQPTLRLTPADCAAGVVTAEIAYHVRTNDPRGYELRLAPRRGYSTEVEVAGLQAPVVVGAEEVSVYRTVPAREDRLRLRLRARLIPGVLPGHYPLPLVVSVATLP